MPDPLTQRAATLSGLKWCAGAALLAATGLGSLWARDNLRGPARPAGAAAETPAPQPVIETAEQRTALEKGRALVVQHRCDSCHVIEEQGGDAQGTWPDFVAPGLDGEGRKVRSDWLIAYLRNPSPIRPWLASPVPHNALSEEAAAQLAEYFFSLAVQPYPSPAARRRSALPRDLKAAAELFSEEYFDCASCHVAGKKMPAGGQENWAPDFVLAAKRLNPDWIINWIKNPQAIEPGTRMPAYFPTEYFKAAGPDEILGGDENRQIRALRDYLLTLPPVADAP